MAISMFPVQSSRDPFGIALIRTFTDGLEATLVVFIWLRRVCYRCLIATGMIYVIQCYYISICHDQNLSSSSLTQGAFYRSIICPQLGQMKMIYCSSPKASQGVAHSVQVMTPLQRTNTVGFHLRCGTHDTLHLLKGKKRS